MQGPTQPPVGGPGGRFNIVVIQNQSSVVRTNYRQKPSYLLGVIQVSTGILCVIFQSVEDALGGSGSTGIGAGIFVSTIKLSYLLEVYGYLLYHHVTTNKGEEVMQFVHQTYTINYTISGDEAF